LCVDQTPEPDRGRGGERSLLAPLRKGKEEEKGENERGEEEERRRRQRSLSQSLSLSLLRPLHAQNCLLGKQK